MFKKEIPKNKYADICALSPNPDIPKWSNFQNVWGWYVDPVSPLSLSHVEFEKKEWMLN